MVEFLMLLMQKLGDRSLMGYIVGDDDDFG